MYRDSLEVGVTIHNVPRERGVRTSSCNATRKGRRPRDRREGGVRTRTEMAGAHCSSTISHPYSAYPALPPRLLVAHSTPHVSESGVDWIGTVLSSRFFFNF